jgi:hypothetical protein
MAMSNAERNRRWRAARGARIGAPPGPAPTQPCGTHAAYRRHQRRKEPPCEACRAAEREYRRRYA